MEERGGLRRWREEDIDEYVEDAEENGYGYDDYEDEGEEGDEEEEEEGHKLTQEELDYLKTRERLKEQIRQKHRKENGTGGRGMASSERKRPSSYNAGFGSFFGPSQPVIARRVIEESHSLRETQHITSKNPNCGSTNKPSPVISNGERKINAPKIVSQVKTKAERLKDMRDYSFLFSDDSDLPTSREDHSRKSSSTNSTQAPPKSKIPPNRLIKPAPSGSVLKKTSHVSHHTQARAGSSKLPLESRSKLTVGSGPGQPPVRKTMTNASHDASSKKSPVVSNASHDASSKKSPVVANKVGLERKNLAVRPGSSSKKHDQYQGREIQQRPKAMVPPRQPPSSSKLQQSKQQSNYPSKSSQPCYPSKPQQPSSSSNLQRKSNPSNPQHLGYSSNPHKSGASLNPQRKGTSMKPQQQGHSLKPQPSKLSKSLIRQSPKGNLLKKKPTNKYSDEENEDDEAISMIRKMFRYNPNRYQDDDDDSDMEANFDDIMMEERRSSRIAKKEDEEQLRLIEEEERQERMRKMSKKRRLG